MRYKKEIVTPAPDSHVYLKDIMQLDVDIFNAYCDAHLEPGHDWGPQIRDHYVLEYCIHGRGELRMGGSVFPVESGQCFMIFPDTDMTLHADKSEPWGLSYVVMKGVRLPYYIKQMGLAPEAPVFPWRDEWAVLEKINRLIELYSPRPGDMLTELKILSVAYDLLATCYALCLKNQTSRAELDPLICKALYYIEDHYAQRPQIAEISRHVGLNRSYFCSLFKEQTGETPLQYINRLCVKKATVLLSDPYVTVGDVGSSLGLEPQSFSRLFKRIAGISPGEYRRLHLKNKEPRQP